MTRLAEGFTRQQIDTHQVQNPAFVEYLQQMNDPHGTYPELMPCLEELKETHPALMQGIEPNHVQGAPPGKCTDVTGQSIDNKTRLIRRQATELKSKLTRSGHNASGWDKSADAYKYAKEMGDMWLYILYRFLHAHPDVFERVTRTLPDGAQTESGVKRGESPGLFTPAAEAKKSRVEVVHSLPSALFEKTPAELAQAENEAQLALVEAEEAAQTRLVRKLLRFAYLY